MPGATFKHGSPRMVEHETGGSAINAGDVIVTETTPRIAHLPIPANHFGSLAAAGGVYEMTGDATINSDVPVYWVADDGKISEDDDGGNNVFLGITVTECADNNATALVRHEPQAVPAD